MIVMFSSQSDKDTDNVSVADGQRQEIKAKFRTSGVCDWIGRFSDWLGVVGIVKHQIIYCIPREWLQRMKYIMGSFILKLN